MPQTLKNYAHRLEDIGLAPNEALTYAALLELGLTTTGPIAKQTGLHSQLVYQALDNLMAKRLTSYISKRNRKYFQASIPEELMNGIRQKEESARALIPELKKLQKREKDPLQVKIMYGQEGFIANLRDVVESAGRHDKIMRIIGGAAAKDFYRVVGAWYQNYVNLLTREKVAKWQISPDSTSTEFKEKFAREANTILKIMPPDFSSITQTRITPELATIEIYGEETIVIQIWNKSAAAGYRTYFDFLWKQGKRYAPRER